MYYSKLVAFGSYLPEKFLTNEELSKTVDTSDDWIVSRTGITKRHIAAENEATSDLAFKALQNLAKKFKYDLTTIDAIIVATTTPDQIFPATACILQNKIQANKAFAFDINAACTGFVYAVIMANTLIQCGRAKKVAVVGAEVMSRIVDWNDRTTCVLFGDGAGVFVFEATTNPEENSIINNNIYSDGGYTDILQVNGGVSKVNPNAKIEMNGREVFRNAVEKMFNSTTDQLLTESNLTIEEIDWVLPHQANQRILDMLASKLNINEDKVISTIHQHANTSAASIPLAFCEYYNKGRITKEQKIILTAIGAGITWGSVLLKV